MLARESQRLVASIDAKPVVTTQWRHLENVMKRRGPRPATQGIEKRVFPLRLTVKQFCFCSAAFIVVLTIVNLWMMVPHFCSSRKLERRHTRCARYWVAPLFGAASASSSPSTESAPSCLHLNWLGQLFGGRLFHFFANVE